MKFYDNLDQTIKQIVEETYSYKTPISINLSEEMYNYFQVFALLNKKDLPKAIQTEFESYCADKNYNPNVFETRYAITPNTQDKEKLKVIHVSENKIELNKKLQKFNGYKLQNITPVSMTIPSIAELEEKENCLIVNIEEDTTITTVIDKNIYDTTKLDIGSREILDKINVKENSYQKAYEQFVLQISELYKRYTYVLECEAIDPDDKEIFSLLKAGQASEAQISRSLSTLMRMLQTYYQNRLFCCWMSMMCRLQKQVIMAIMIRCWN